MSLPPYSVVFHGRLPVTSRGADDVRFAPVTQAKCSLRSNCGQQDAAHEGNEPSSATGSLRTSVYPWAACPGLERVGPRRRRPRTGTHAIM